jgi:group I intron endonuclease
MKNIVYKITNTINNKVYIGVTQQDLKIRWQQHKCNSNKKTYHLYNAIRKYGFSNFQIEVIFKANDKDEMFAKEIELISKYKSNNRVYGYNNSLGGEKSRKGTKLSKEQKMQISVFQKNRLRKPHSIETKEKMSKAAKGKDMSKLIIASSKKRKGKPALNKKAIILNDIEIFNSLTEASLKYNILVSSISNNIKGLSKKTKVGIWKIYEHKN